MASVAQGGDRSPAIGRVLSRAFETIGANPLAVFGVAFVFAALPHVLFTVGGRALLTAGAGALGFSALTFSGLLGSIVSSAITQGALVRITVAHAEGRRASIGEALWAGLRMILPLLALGLLMALGVGFGLTLLFVPGLILWLMWSVAAPALAAERCGVFGAFGRSRALTKGARWRIFALELVVVVFYWLITGVFGIAAIMIAARPGPLSNFLWWTLAGAAISKTLTAAIWGTIQCSLYVELRDWKDGPASDRLADIFA